MGCFKKVRHFTEAVEVKFAHRCTHRAAFRAETDLYPSADTSFWCTKFYFKEATLTKMAKELLCTVYRCYTNICIMLLTL